MAENFTNAVKGLAFGEHGVNGVLGDAHPKRRSKKDHDTDEVPETGKRKRVTKVKDPNAPKRPASSYILFQNSIRADLKKEHPNIQNAELLGLIAKQWQEMPEEDKNVSLHVIKPVAACRRVFLSGVHQADGIRQRAVRSRQGSV